MNLEIFKNSGFELRGGLINNEPYFMLADVCRALGLSNPSSVKDRLLRDGLDSIETIDSLGRTQQATFINESNLYRAIFQSRKEEALQFQEWVTSEVLPSIRKNGIYATAPTLENMINNPDFAIELLNNLKKERELKEIAQKQNTLLVAKIQEDKPLTDFGRAISQSKASIGVGVFAKTIEKELSIKFGRNKCFEWLRDNGFLMSKESNKNQPYQKWIDQGIFEVVQGLRQNSTFQKIDITTLITGKGQEYLFDKILKDLSK
jgi:anti-repressor protein